jgi:hypothetical protein
VKAARIVLLVALVAAVVVLIVNGAQTERGESIVGPAGDLARGIVGGVRDITPGLSDTTAGNLAASLLIGLGVYVVAALAIPGVTATRRAFVGTGVACLLLTMALFSPALVDQVTQGVGG